MEGNHPSAQAEGAEGGDTAVPAKRGRLRLIASRHAEGSRRLLDELDRAYEELQAAGEPLQLD